MKTWSIFHRIDPENFSSFRTSWRPCQGYIDSFFFQNSTTDSCETIADGWLLKSDIFCSNSWTLKKVHRRCRRRSGIRPIWNGYGYHRDISYSVSCDAASMNGKTDVTVPCVSYTESVKNPKLWIISLTFRRLHIATGLFVNLRQLERIWWKPPILLNFLQF